jgi:hypothetical protein
MELPLVELGKGKLWMQHTSVLGKRVVVLFVLYFEIGFCYIAQAGLELTILLLHLLSGGDYRCVPSGKTQGF